MAEESLTFNTSGLLPKGDYEMTFQDIQNSLLVQGPDNPKIAAWDTPWRAHLVKQAELLVNQLWNIGITNIYLDGSFVEAKPHPNDIDGYSECDTVDLAQGIIHQKLNKIDPHKVWTWNTNERKIYRNYPKKQLPMWHVYRVELWPHANNSSGITDKFGNQMTFPAAFRTQRNSYAEKGIVKLVQ